ncbi:MAG: MT-A70 family methyltransferase [Nocardioides sp.]|uniref:MT-A70 family methyltransferase n=1 Tax=Nocardioides sp. TaxID=35761 RepID=UPI0039E3C317
MTDLATVTDLDIERLVHLDQRVDAAEGDGLRARWEFGQQMLAARDGAGRLPNGYLAALVERTGKSRTELARRIRFADRFPGEDELCHAVTQFPSWHEVVKHLKAEKDAEDSLPVHPAEAPEGTFRTFVADPPWDYGNTSTRNAAAKHYKTMSTEDLCALDVVPEHAADEAHLYLWTTSSHLPEAFAVMSAWGFDYKTYLVWVKPQIGMGNYFRVSTELALFGVRGGMRTLRRDVRNHFEVSRSKHSAKPPQFHDLVASCSPGPYMELFSRCGQDDMLDGLCQCSKCRLGWTVWGDQS